MRATLFFLVLAVVVIGHVHGYSSSMSCYFVNGQRVCQQQSDPNGNSAYSGAGTNGNDGQVYGNAGQYGNSGRYPPPVPMYPYYDFFGYYR